MFLVRNLDLSGVQLIATYRADNLHRGHPLRRLLPELERLPEITRLELGPLSREEAGRQAAAIRGHELEAEELRELYERSDGIPLFVESIAQCPTDCGAVPERSRELLLSSQERVREPARALARVASVGAVSGEVEHGLLHRVAGLPEAELESALRSLVDANVLRVTSTGYRFRHALLREAVHLELLPGQHARLHLSFAEALDRWPGAVPQDRLAAEQAHHYHAAHDLPRALQAAWQAADRAARALAFTEELGMLERVLEMWDRVPDASERTGGRSRGEVTAKAVEAAMDSGRLRLARRLCDAGLAELPEDGDTAARTLRGVLLRQRAQVRKQLTDWDGAEDLAAAARVHPPGAPGHALLLSLLAQETLMHCEELAPGLSSSAAPLAEEAVRQAEASGSVCVQADALITLGRTRFASGDTAAGEDLIRTGIALARESHEVVIEQRGIACLSDHLREAGRVRESIELLELAPARARSLDLTSVNGVYCALDLAEAHLDEGRLAAAREYVDLGLSWGPSPCCTST